MVKGRVLKGKKHNVKEKVHKRKQVRASQKQATNARFKDRIK